MGSGRCRRSGAVVPPLPPRTRVLDGTLQPAHQRQVLSGPQQRTHDIVQPVRGPFLAARRRQSPTLVWTTGSRSGRLVAALGMTGTRSGRLVAALADW